MNYLILLIIFIIISLIILNYKKRITGSMEFNTVNYKENEVKYLIIPSSKLNKLNNSEEWEYVNEINKLLTELAGFITTTCELDKMLENNIYNILLLLDAKKTYKVKTDTETLKIHPVIGMIISYYLPPNNIIYFRIISKLNNLLGKEEAKKYYEQYLKQAVYLQSFIINKNYRGNGYSSLIMDLIKHTIYPKNKIFVLEVKKNNTQAINVYKHFGFNFVKNLINPNEKKEMLTNSKDKYEIMVQID